MIQVESAHGTHLVYLINHVRRWTQDPLSMVSGVFDCTKASRMISKATCEDVAAGSICRLRATISSMDSCARRRPAASGERLLDFFLPRVHDKRSVRRDACVAWAVLGRTV